MDNNTVKSLFVILRDKEYFEAVQQFYEERLKSQLKEKFRKCEGCKEDKHFIEVI